MSISGDTGSDLFELIKNNPGTHFRKLIELSDRAVGVVEYHIKRLEHENIIFSVKQGGFTRYFDFTWKDRLDQVKFLIGHLRKRTSRKLILLLSLYPEYETKSLKELAESMGKSPPALNWHVKSLVNDLILEPVRRGRTVTLRLKIERSVVNTLGKDIYPSRWDEFLDNIHDLFQF